MTKKIEIPSINNCDECPFLRFAKLSLPDQLSDNIFSYCIKAAKVSGLNSAFENLDRVAGSTIKSFDTIPDFCPLTDKEASPND